MPANLPLIDDTSRAQAEVERYVHRTSPNDPSMQWLVEEVFNDFHGFFRLKHALDYEDPLSGRRWKASPPLDVFIGGRMTTVVAAMHADALDHDPIYFFADRCDGQALGVMSVSHAIFDPLRPTDLTMDFIEIESVPNGKGVDFHDVTGNELHDFTDELTHWVMTHPHENAVDKAARAVGDVSLDAIEGTVNGVAGVMRWTGHGVGKIARGIGRVVTAPFRAIGRGLSYSYYSYTFGEIHAGRLLAQIAGLGAALCAGAFGIMRGVDRASVTPSEYDPFHGHLPAASALPFSDAYERVSELTPEEAAALGNPPNIHHLDQHDFELGEADTNWENSVVNPEYGVGRVRDIPIPDDGKCVTVQTFNIPDGVVRMVATSNTPRLLVSVQQVDGFVYEGEEEDYGRAKKREDDTRDAELVEATVCNPERSEAVDFDTPDDAHLMIEFTQTGAPTR